MYKPFMFHLNIYILVFAYICILIIIQKNYFSLSAANHIVPQNIVLGFIHHSLTLGSLFLIIIWQFLYLIIFIIEYIFPSAIYESQALRGGTCLHPEMKYGLEHLDSFYVLQSGKTRIKHNMRNG